MVYKTAVSNTARIALRNVVKLSFLFSYSQQSKNSDEVQTSKISCRPAYSCSTDQLCYAARAYEQAGSKTWRLSRRRPLVVIPPALIDIVFTCTRHSLVYASLS